MPQNVLPGQSFPLGATVYPWGVNFSVFSKNCKTVEILLFDDADADRPARVIPLDPQINRTFYYWHAFVSNIKHGQIYGYRVDGDFNPAEALRFDGEKVLLDPYTRAVAVGKNYDRAAASRPGDNAAYAMKSVVVNPRDYEWDGDMQLHHTYAESVIYEMHVGGFTKHPNSGLPAELRGTYAGVIEKIPYLKALGITAVELLPVQQFDPQNAPPELSNYWGYSSVAFFAPHHGYSSAPEQPLGAINEFRDMVKALHRAGIEVILDVVFNHTAEGDHKGPTLSFRGLENRAYYIPAPDPARYANFSGCGNTFNTNQSIVRRLIIDCLHYWFAVMHVDGFRFDLASVLARDEWGKPLKSPPILWEIESDPILAGSKIIAEAWDAGGLYQVGNFIGHRWAEWNGQYRDNVRQFIKSDPHTVKNLAARIVGSPDIYSPRNEESYRSINFITCHDGFTLNDMVSFNNKHNALNQESNRDGADANYSWNCGLEGPTTELQIIALRKKQIKNALTVLFFSQGTPMLLMGDEVQRTQLGNNNAYCQDNDISWFDWKQLKNNADMLRFTRKLINYTQTLDILREEDFLVEDGRGKVPCITWHGVDLCAPDWSENSHTLAFELHHQKNHEHLYLGFNAYWRARDFNIPPLPKGQYWYRLIDTQQAAPQDFCDLETAPRVPHTSYRLAARSAVVLVVK